MNNKPSQLLAALEQDQEKALERFYADWDKMVGSDTYKFITWPTLRLSLKSRPEVCLCPIIAVYLQRYGTVKNNGDYRSVGIALDLSHADTNRIASASDGYIRSELQPYKERLFRALKGERKEQDVEKKT